MLSKKIKQIKKVPFEIKPKVRIQSISIIIISLLVLFLTVGYFLEKPSYKPSYKVSNNREVQTKNMTPAPKHVVNSPLKQAKPTPTSLSIPLQTGKQVRVPILTYHYIGNNPNKNDKARDNLEVTPDKFEEQMKFISQAGYQTISFDTLYASLKGNSSLPGKPLILTFDDGYIDFYLNAFPILQKYGLHAVSFIPTGLIGNSYYMNWDQIKQIDSSGLVSFQAHSVSHANLAALNDSELKRQVLESKKVLESQLGKPVNTFAYPYGISDARIWQAVKSAGFIGAVGTWYGEIESEGTIYDMPRIKVAGGIDIKTFASRF